MRQFHKIIFLILVIAATGCKDRSGHLMNIAGHLPDLHIELTSHEGKKITEQDFQGFVTLLYFGFTSCPDECPQTLSRLTHVRERLGAEAKSIRILFVSVDPVHDTPEILKEYLQKFSPDIMVGLTGSMKDIRKLTSRYRVVSPSEDAPIHSSAVYIFDRQGQARFIITDKDSIQTITEQIRKLVRQ